MLLFKEQLNKPMEKRQKIVGEVYSNTIFLRVQKDLILDFLLGNSQGKTLNYVLFLKEFSPIEKIQHPRKLKM